VTNGRIKDGLALILDETGLGTTATNQLATGIKLGQEHLAVKLEITDSLNFTVAEQNDVSFRQACKI